MRTGETLTAIEAGKEEGTWCGGCSVGSKAGAKLVLEGAEKPGVRSIKIQDLFRLQWGFSWEEVCPEVTLSETGWQVS